MADPYVNWAPAEVGPCTATWFVGPTSGSVNNDTPTFGPSFGEVNQIGAWDFLVDGPLKDTLTRQFTSIDDALEAWATAGGSIDFTAQDAEGYSIYTTQPHLVLPVPAGQPCAMTWFLLFDSVLYSARALPIRWVVKFSVPHSIIR